MAAEKMIFERCVAARLKKETVAMKAMPLSVDVVAPVLFWELNMSVDAEKGKYPLLSELVKKNYFCVRDGNANYRITVRQVLSSRVDVVFGGILLPLTGTTLKLPALSVFCGKPSFQEKTLCFIEGAENIEKFLVSL